LIYIIFVCEYYSENPTRSVHVRLSCLGLEFQMINESSNCSVLQYSGPYLLNAQNVNILNIF